MLLIPVIYQISVSGLRFIVMDSESFLATEIPNNHGTMGHIYASPPFVVCTWVGRYELIIWKGGYFPLLSIPVATFHCRICMGVPVKGFKDRRLQIRLFSQPGYH